MKKIILLLAIIFLGQKINAQTNADCINSIPLCTTPNFTFFQTTSFGNVDDIPTNSNISNPTTNPASANSGCLLTGENNPQWLLITIGNPGNLEFAFGAGTSANPQAGFYDWAMWPYSSTSCANIANNTLPPIRCNWNGTSTGGTGLASPANMAAIGGSASNFEPPLAVNACQQFIICISNYSNINTLVSFQSIGTASLSCNPNCNPNYTICAGTNATITPVNFAALSNPNFSITPGGLSNTTGSFVVSPMVTTTYTTFITGLNSNNAVQTITATSVVSVNAQPSAAPTTTQSTCTNTNNAFNLGLTFNPVSPVPNYTVTWSPTPFSITNNTQTSGSGGIAPGQYNATITSVGGCSTTTNFNISPLPLPPVFSLGGTSYTVTCAQPTVFVSVTPTTYSYTWTNGITTPQSGPTGSFTTLELGTWSVTAINPASGCSSTQTFVVTQNFTVPSSSVSPTTQSVTCPLGAQATFTGTALNPTVNVTHMWLSPQGGTLTSGGVTSLYSGTQGTHTFVLINNVNGCSVTKTVQVTSVLGFPTFSVGSSPGNFTLGCSSKSVAALNIISPNSTPIGSPLSFTVVGPSTSANYSLDPGTGPQNYTVNTPGTWTVVVHDNNNECETQVLVSIIQNTFSPNASAIVPQQTLTCYVPTTTLQGVSTNTNTSYTWTGPGAVGTVASYTIPIVSTVPTASFVANYTLTVTDNNNFCKSFSVVPIYQNQFPPSAKINPQTSSLTCNTNTVSLANGSTKNAPLNFFSPLAAASVTWCGPSPQVCDTYTNSFYTAFTPGIYTMTAVDLNNGCSSSTTATVFDNKVYPVASDPPPFLLDCGVSSSNPTKIFPIFTFTPGYTYLWRTPSNATVSPVSLNTLTISTLSPGIYAITITHSLTGCAVDAHITVVNGGLTGDFTPSALTGFAPLTVNFTNGSSSTNGTASITSVWSFGNGTSATTTSTSVSPSATYNSPGTYTVTMYVAKGACLDTVVKVITIDIPSKLEVPNVFTPNGDGSNDVFFLKVQNVSEINAKIFDRWGNQVYETTSSTGNIEWNGTNQAGKDLPAGTYFYIIKAAGKDGTEYDKKGNVSIYR